ncbi:uncharacterized protein LOC126761703 [Bactrocera neohumeralis]|uniref:uncharacterized protein LOC120778016 n=1 Tax=Bactrocera tryoni TaxID=59916 RepID=UPI001A98A2BB|nr:uncharacterized protein LOC120778016 [Bactrocera tryoni]XP_039965618.1 uncharacterized protein LOC120778016 [Bactrocera tryoni]XP_039965619.1 uncharacterized protein LOC120778016 [Bactrocera tryoni]XP_039965620.1 uncharacterized protein LOC120778016 [Bactrocera tryoni]XP_050334020.1 uncharacterized protein LOC126761703 [Bactrocera neohumeralis]XP_050334022.1 uncharacterized protein LOC126761703 [Bactrocera neohumeralis]XP_050334023.1 uncharacterized protein LOC126761703 [Bactrocera neohume
MVYSIQNSETGELHYIHRDLSNVRQQVLDLETGEPLNGTKVKVRYVKHNNFQIPKKFLCDPNEKETEAQNLYNAGSPPAATTPMDGEGEEKSPRLYKKEDFIKMDGVRNDIILGYQNQTYQLFLIPTLFCCSLGLFFIMLLCESILHCWAHKKNSLNISKIYYFRSPLHLVTSQFCTVCRRENEMKKIEIFQALNKQVLQAARQSKTLKDMSKVIS